MKVVAVLMVLIGATLGYGAVKEFFYHGPESPGFWAGVVAAPAGLFFAVAGVMLWVRGMRVRQTVLLSALAMLTATIVATVLQVMGVLATLMGVIGSFAAIGWFLFTTPQKSTRST